MTQVCSVYSQLLQLFPRRQFAQIVKQHQAEYNAKGFTCREQFLAMLFCQVAHLNSLREVCLGLAGCESLLKHLGINTAPKRSTLAYANANRPWELYESVYWVVAFQSGRARALATVHLPGLVGVVEQSDGRTASGKETGRAVTHAADLVAGSWTAAEMQAST